MNKIYDISLFMGHVTMLHGCVVEREREACLGVRDRRKRMLICCV